MARALCEELLVLFKRVVLAVEEILTVQFNQREDASEQLYDG